VVVGPIVSQYLSDVFCDNEYGPNFLFVNNGDGTFTDVAQQAGERKMERHLIEQVYLCILIATPYITVVCFILKVKMGVPSVYQVWKTLCSTVGG
jgi:hypothetical protein